MGPDSDSKNKFPGSISPGHGHTPATPAGGRSTPILSLSKEDAALLASLTPEMAALLYPEHTAGPLTVTLVYPELEQPARIEASDLEAAAADHTVVDAVVPGETARHRTTFTLRQVEQLHQLYHLLETTIGVDKVDILLSGRRLPLARELWLPLVWTLRS